MKKKEDYETEIKKYGNSHILVIPPFLMKKLKLSEGELIKIHIQRLKNE